KIVITWDKIADTAQELTRNCPVEKIVSVNMIDAMPGIKRFALKLPLKSLKEKRELLHAPAPGTIPFADLLSGKIGGGGKDVKIHPDLSAEDAAFILFTSGTTGKPKGALLTHGNVMANVVQGLAWVKDLGQEGQERYLAALPLFHI